MALTLKAICIWASTMTAMKSQVTCWGALVAEMVAACLLIGFRRCAVVSEGGRADWAVVAFAAAPAADHVLVGSYPSAAPQHSASLTHISAARAMSWTLTHSSGPWMFCIPVKRLGVGTPFSVRREPSVPPRMG